jgi:lactoylglutathione lyase
MSRPARKLDHVTLMVTSFAASMPYYDALLPLLGFHKTKDHIWTDGDGFFFQFHEAHPGTRPYERYGAGLNHLGFGARSPDDVEHVRAGMAAAGFEVPAIQDLDGARALFLKDPDGVRFELTWYPPESKVVD